MRKYLDDAGGDIEILHLSPHIIQINPIEVEWREIRATIADIFFDGLDSMRDTIRQIIHNGEMPIVKMAAGTIAARYISELSRGRKRSVRIAILYKSICLRTRTSSTTSPRQVIRW